MSFEEEFDRIIRRKAEEENYPFDEKNWEKTSRLLDADKKAARLIRVKRFYVPALVLTTLGLVGLLFINYAETEADGGSEIALYTPNAETDGNSNLPRERSTGIRESASVPDVPLTTTQQAVNTTSEKTNPRLSNTAEEAAVSALTQATQNQSGNTASFSSEKITSKKQVSAPALQNGTENKVSNTSSRAEERAAEKPLKETLAANPQQNMRNNTMADINTVQASVPQKEQMVSNSIQENNPEPSENETSSNEEVYSESLASLQADYLNAIHTTLPDALRAEKTLLTEPFVYLKRYEDDYFEKTNLLKKHYLHVEGGANYVFGWQSGALQDGSGFNWYAGFNYGRYLNRKMSVSAGLQVYNLANMNQPFYRIAEKEYGFGSIPVYTEVTSNQLYYLAIPLKWTYSISSSHQFGVGVNAGYLVAANSSVSKYYVLDNERKAIGEESATSQGIYAGTRMMNVMLTAHYQARISQRLKINAEFNYGISDIFENMGEITSRETPMGIRFGLAYTLFDK